MSEYDLMYMSWIGDKILKDPEMTNYWVNALKEHLAFLQDMQDKKRLRLDDLSHTKDSISTL